MLQYTRATLSEFFTLENWFTDNRVNEIKTTSFQFAKECETIQALKIHALPAKCIVNV